MKTQFYSIKPWEKKYLQNKIQTLGLPIETEFIVDQLDKDHIPPYTSVEIISVFVGSVVDQDVINSFPNLKLITTRSTGYNHLDVVSAKEKNIPVAHVPTYGENTVAIADTEKRLKKSPAF
ncbi:MAG: D-lactate dehydrogenase [Parcubacteria group bacterium Gr01-1014_20]|nr:MAG: D-lactate dehydrogenase [Parcubacteria group bacterium Gr01-1014_20]